MARWMLVVNAEGTPVCVIRWNPGSGLDFGHPVPASLRQYVVENYGPFGGELGESVPEPLVIEWPDDPPPMA